MKQKSSDVSTKFQKQKMWMAVAEANVSSEQKGVSEPLLPFSSSFYYTIARLLFKL